MFFRRQSSTTHDSAATATRQPSRTEYPSRPDLADVDGAALDALVTILRSYGRHALDTDAGTAENTRTLVARWVKHATLGISLADGNASGERDWRALGHDFNEHRRAETVALGGSMNQLRDAVWSLLGSVHMAMVEDQRDHEVASKQLSRLREATAGASAAELKQVAESTLTVFDTVLASQRERQRAQQEQLGAQLRALSNELEEARRASTLDPLTELPNRKEFDDFSGRVLQLNTFVPSPSCLLMIDVDGFKRLNDQHGHQLGDMALQEVAHALSRTFLRRCDFVCRYGGDEFAAIMRDCTPDAALRQAERVCAAIRELRLPERASGAQLSLSIGIARLRPGDTVEEWLSRADRALYRAKESGRNQAAVED